MNVFSLTVCTFFLNYRFNYSNLPFLLTYCVWVALVLCLVWLPLPYGLVWLPLPYSLVWMVGITTFTSVQLSLFLLQQGQLDRWIRKYLGRQISLESKETRQISLESKETRQDRKLDKTTITVERFFTIRLIFVLSS